MKAFTLTIRNKAALDRWLADQRRLGKDVYAVKGPAPEGAAYEDGTPIRQPINLAWRDGLSGETFRIEYEHHTLEN